MVASMEFAQDPARVSKFWKRTQIVQAVDGMTECWEWTGSTTVGYGTIGFNRTQFYAHRLSWSLTNRMEIPEGMCICHKCDNRRCVRPSHLFLGTYKDNTQDAMRKNRLRRGDDCSFSRLSEADVTEIRRKRSEGYTLRELAQEYGVTVMTIKRAAIGVTWRHVSEATAVNRPEIRNRRGIYEGVSYDRATGFFRVRYKDKNIGCARTPWGGAIARAIYARMVKEQEQKSAA